MEIAREQTPLPLRAAWLSQAQQHPWTTLGLAILAMLWLLLASVWQVVGGEAEASLRLAMVGSGVGFAATALGAFPGVALKGLSQRLEDNMLGLAAGMMLAASSFSLILPGLEAGEALTGNGGLAAATVVAGMAIGVLLMLGLDQFTPHEHGHGGLAAPASSE